MIMTHYCSLTYIKTLMYIFMIMVRLCKLCTKVCVKITKKCNHNVGVFIINYFAISTKFYIISLRIIIHCFK